MWIGKKKLASVFVDTSAAWWIFIRPNICVADLYPKAV
jgi:hypothetical protein